MIAVRLPIEIEKRLDILAQATGRTKTFYVREAIMEHLDDLEDLYLAEQRLLQNIHSEQKNILLEDIMKKYGLEN